MKIAIIGSGISGLTAALIALKNGHTVTLFEKADYFGGHSNTIDFAKNEKRFPVDTGFLVHNRLTYPHLVKIFEYLDVPTEESDMTLSIRHLEDNIEWGGENLSTVFSQKKNILNPQFYKFIIDILKFNKKSSEYLQQCLINKDKTLGDLLNENNHSEELKKWYLVPMAAAIWSTPADKILEFPAWTFLQFCINHHLLQVNNRPKWRTIVGGSRVYVKKITDQIDAKHLNCNIQKVKRTENSFQVFIDNTSQTFDIGIFATHPLQSLNLLESPTLEETKLLSNFKYQQNIAVVHDDKNILSKQKKLWAAWNYLNTSRESNKLCVSYLINKLQKLPIEEPVIVSLNMANEAIERNKIHKVIEYEHPLFDVRTLEAQSQIFNIQGKLSTYFVGAWQRYGFHEDGARSSIEVAKKLGWIIPWE